MDLEFAPRDTGHGVPFLLFLRCLHEKLRDWCGSVARGCARGSRVPRAARRLPWHRVRLLDAALRDLIHWRVFWGSLHHLPISPEQAQPTVTVLTDASMTAHGVTLRDGGGERDSRGYYGLRGFWDGAHR